MGSRAKGSKVGESSAQSTDDLIRSVLERVSGLSGDVKSMDERLSQEMGQLTSAVKLCATKQDLDVVNAAVGRVDGRVTVLEADKAKLESMLAAVQQGLAEVQQRVQQTGAGSSAAAAGAAGHGPGAGHTSVTEVLKARSSLIIYCESEEARQLMDVTELERSADVSARAMACLSIACNILESKCPLVLSGSGRSAIEVQNAYRMRLKIPRPVPPIVAQLASPAQAELYLQFSRSPGGKAALAQAGITVRPWLTASEKQQKTAILNSRPWLDAVDAAKLAGHGIRWDGAVPKHSLL